MLALYVDDLIVASTSRKAITDLEVHLRSKYSMKPMGDIEYMLGLILKRDRNAKHTFAITESLRRACAG